jgi:glycosyltransferase involved in cell wall biosynthesis
MTTVTDTAFPASRDLAVNTRVRPVVAVVTPCRATYFKPLWESFAQAQPQGWRTELFWPESHVSEHPEHLLTPAGDNLMVHRVASRKMSAAAQSGGSSQWRPAQRFNASRELWQALAAAKPRLVVVQEYSPFALVGLLYARFHGLPVVTFTEVGARNQHLFNFRVRAWHGFWSWWVQGIAAACPTAHVPISRKRLPSISIYHAVDSRQYRPKQNAATDAGRPVTFVYVGQFIPRKGLDLWVAAARTLREQTPAHFRLRFIGAGDESWLRGLVHDASLDDFCEWHGFLSGAELREAMRGGDVFVLPSRHDTYAVVSHEAACLGLPLLISKHAGSAEALVREGENGHVIDPEDTATFTAAMRAMLDADKRESMARAARRSGEEMSAHARGAALWQWMSETFALREMESP